MTINSLAKHRFATGVEREVFWRDGFTCQECNRSFPASFLATERIVPRAEGRHDTAGDFMTVCWDCHSTIPEILSIVAAEAEAIAQREEAQS